MDSTTKPFNKKRKLEQMHAKNGKIKKLKLQTENKNLMNASHINNNKFEKDADNIFNKPKVLNDCFLSLLIISYFLSVNIY